MPEAASQAVRLLQPNLMLTIQLGIALRSVLPTLKCTMPMTVIILVKLVVRVPATLTPPHKVA